MISVKRYTFGGHVWAEYIRFACFKAKVDPANVKGVAGGWKFCGSGPTNLLELYFTRRTFSVNQHLILYISQWGQ